ncbi:MAG: shikimate dehydrogenase [Candidatus Peregrinibacteria bacterium]|nr:shikimate dehydrogenase [Candidatus Peregrinibacteria bacterium]
MTQLLGIVAHPVSHSLSPSMQNAALQALGIDAHFEMFDVPPEELKIFMEERSDIAGLAVSLPHKETVGQYLDGVDEIAQKIGVVNTVYMKNGQRWGINTDAPGFMKALKEVMPSLKGKRVLVIGAGGAARAVLSVLVPEADSVTVINRTVPKGVEIAKAFGCRYGGKMEDLDTETPDLIVNTTSVGLEGVDEPLLVPEDFIEPDMVVFDIVYRLNGRTRLLQDAQAAGAKTIDGCKMLLYQGMMQFELWTGEKAPQEIMERALGRC